MSRQSQRVDGRTPNTIVVTTGGAGTPPTISWGPDFGVAAKPEVGVHVSMGALELSNTLTEGVNVTMPALEIDYPSSNLTEGVNLTMPSLELAGTLTEGVNLTMPSLELAGTLTEGVNVTMPTLELDSSTSLTTGVHLTGVALGAPNFKSIGTTSSTTSAGTTFVANAPSGIVVGDLLVAILGYSNLAAMNTPSGWTADTWTQRAGALNNKIVSYYKIADSGDVGASTFTFTSITNLGAAWAAIFRFDGIDSTTPINVSANSGLGGSAISPVSPSVTTTVANCLIIIACVQNSAVDITYTPPANYTERSDLDGAGAAGVHLLDGETATIVQAATGANGAQTMTSTSLLATDYSAITIAIAPGNLTLA